MKIKKCKVKDLIMNSNLTVFEPFQHYTCNIKDIRLKQVLIGDKWYSELYIKKENPREVIGINNYQTLDNFRDLLTHDLYVKYKERDNKNNLVIGTRKAKPSKYSFDITYERPHSGYFSINYQELKFEDDMQRNSYYYSDKYLSKSITVDNLKDFLEKEVSITEEDVCYYKVSPYKLQIGDKVVNNLGELFKVVKITEKDLNSFIIETENAEGKKTNFENISYLHYNPLTYTHPFKQLVEPLNDRILNGRMFEYNHTIDLRWNKIEEAANYQVLIYELYCTNYNDLNLLEEVAIDRNKFHLILENYKSDDLAFVIEALNREGEVIAKSRGLYDGKKIKIIGGNLE